MSSLFTLDHRPRMNIISTATLSNKDNSRHPDQLFSYIDPLRSSKPVDCAFALLQVKRGDQDCRQDGSSTFARYDGSPWLSIRARISWLVSLLPHQTVQSNSNKIVAQIYNYLLTFIAGTTTNMDLVEYGSPLSLLERDTLNTQAQPTARHRHGLPSTISRICPGLRA